MNYNVLRYFSVLAQVEHYTLAAARLGISQPSLSSAIHNLEDELGGVKLFEKSGRNVRLTDEGRFYKEKVDAALEELHIASMALRDSKIGAPIVIRMGVISGILDGAVADTVAAYLQENNRVRFKIVEGSAENLMDLTRQEKLDMAILDFSDRDRSLHFRKLCQRGYYAALPVDHPLADSPVLDPQELAHDPQVAFNYDIERSFKEWASGSLSGEAIVCTVNTAQSALDLVAAGVGICFLPEGCLQPRSDVCYVPLKKWHQALYMCILYDKWLEPPIWDFVEQAVKTLRNTNTEP
jgi:DNA-binding transcriptional LysR family regulator